MSTNEITTTALVAPDIVCGGCAGSIQRALGTREGIVGVRVDVPTRTVTVEHDARVTRDEIAGALDRAGFPAA
jgi:copper chaperone